MTWVPGRGDREDGAVSKAVSTVGRAPGLDQSHVFQVTEKPTYQCPWVQKHEPFCFTLSIPES